MDFCCFMETSSFLMNLCISHGNTKLGDHCAEIIEYLDPRRVDDKFKGLVPGIGSTPEERIKDRLYRNHWFICKENMDGYKPRPDMVHMKEVGYEKLGLAAAPTCSMPRATISIKLLGGFVCVDCHEAFKIAAKLVGRRIVLVNKCAHHNFRDGVCSCGA